MSLVKIGPCGKGLLVKGRRVFTIPHASVVSQLPQLDKFTRILLELRARQGESPCSSDMYEYSPARG